MTIYNQAGKLLEKHHLRYSGMMAWRLGSGIWKFIFQLADQRTYEIMLLIN